MFNLFMSMTLFVLSILYLFEFFSPVSTKVNIDGHLSHGQKTKI